MVRKFLLLHSLSILIIVFQCKSANAQFAFGFEGGYTNNKFISDINASFTEKKPLPGYVAALFVQYSPHRLFALQATAEVLQKNYELRRTGTMSGIYQSFINTYVQLPVTGQIQVRYKRASFYYKLGLYGAYWITARTKGRIPNILNSNSTISNNGTITDYFILTPYNEKYTFQPEKDRRFEFGLTTGAGISYRLTTVVALIAGAKYYHSLTDQQKQFTIDHTPEYNRTITISAGSLFSIYHKKNKQ